MRLRLRSLFAPTDAGDEVARLIDMQGRELEQRSLQLRSAVTEIERREERTRVLHARIEQILRDGAIELDLRQAELAARALELERRETAVAEAEAKLEERTRELGAVELLRAAVERREDALRAREQELERRARALDDRAQITAGDARDWREDEHVAITSNGLYRILMRPGPPPTPGETVELEDGTYRCMRVVPSPYPDDDRRCVLLERRSSSPDA